MLVSFLKIADSLFTILQSWYGKRFRVPATQSRALTAVVQTVAIGYSKFCELFTEEEWKGFNYAYVV